MDDQTQQGFSLIECLITLLIFSMGCLALAKYQLRTGRLMQLMQAYQSAQQAADNLQQAILTRKFVGDTTAVDVGTWQQQTLRAHPAWQIKRTAQKTQLIVQFKFPHQQALRQVIYE